MKLHKHVYNTAEEGWPYKTAQWTLGATVRDKYRGSLLKGWWSLGPRSINRHVEVEVALGGEDNMVQVGAVFLVGRCHIGVRVPRSWTRGWVYERREWTVRVGYIGRWVELMFASDENMRDCGMVSYYRSKRERGEESHTTRAQEWPGVHLTFAPRPIDRLLGRKCCELTEGEWEPCLVPMPEGTYEGRVRREERVWKRPRWPWPSHRRVGWWVEMKEGVPHAGKGENSWDCGDDAVMGTGGPSKAEAIANVTKAAMRNREKYGEASPAPVSEGGERE